MSLSAVTRTTSTGESRTRSTSVPSTSSASKPGTSSRGIRSASNSRRTYGIWTRRSSGVDGRVSLYAANFCSRNVGPGGSQAATKYSGVSSRRSFQTIVDVPSMT